MKAEDSTIDLRDLPTFLCCRGGEGFSIIHTVSAVGVDFVVAI
jgi:hypothetical protein